jgi:hypothetical protein
VYRCGKPVCAGRLQLFPAAVAPQGADGAEAVRQRSSDVVAPIAGEDCAVTIDAFLCQ